MTRIIQGLQMITRKLIKESNENENRNKKKHMLSRWNNKNVA